MIKILFVLLLLIKAAAEENFLKDIILETKKIEFESFPEAFNPSILKTEQGYLLSFRFCPDRNNKPWISYICLVQLDEQFTPLAEPQILSTRSMNTRTPSQAEDARLFSYRDRLYLIYNDNVEITGPSIWDRRDMFLAELLYANNRYALSAPLKLVYKEKYYSTLWQKNWTPFEWDNKLLISYAFTPHEVIFPNLKEGGCYKCTEESNVLPWSFGTLRGSSSALLINGEYLTFFHSSLFTQSDASQGNQLWHYFMGALTFEADPPFKITKITPSPIVADGFYTPSDYYKRVIFPGGFVVADARIYVAYGKDDREIWIATLDKEKLLQALIPVEQ